MSNTVGYVGLALLGGIMVTLIATGAYYVNSTDTNKYSNSSMGVYSKFSRSNSYGGKKTKHHKLRHNKSKKIY